MDQLTETQADRRPVVRDPQVLPEYYDEETGDGRNFGVGWDLSWGCTLTLGPDDDGEWTVTVSMSDEDQRRGILVRGVTHAQVREYARHLLSLVGEDDVEEPTVGNEVV